MSKSKLPVRLLPKSPRIAIVVGVFHKNITADMLQACRDTLRKHSVRKIDVFEVPGAFEIPLMAKKAALTKKYDCIIALGAVIKGKTYHFELVSNECARGCMNVMLETQIPIIFEVLAADTVSLAKKRASGENNRGRDAALCALQLLSALSIHNFL